MFRTGLTAGLLPLTLLVPMLAGCVMQPVPPDRSDLATNYLAIEDAFAANPPQSDSAKADINRRFDRATLAFFTGIAADALRQLDEVLLTLRPDASDDALGDRVAASLLTRWSPPRPVAGQSAATAKLRVASAYVPRGPYAGEVPLRFAIIAPSDDREVWSATQAIRPAPLVPIDLTFTPADALRDLPAGRYIVRVTAPSGAAFDLPPLDLLAESLETVRGRNADRLAAINPDSAELMAAKRIAVARNDLLSDNPDRSRSGLLLVPPDQLSTDVKNEIDALERGENPYRLRAGQTLRALPGMMAASPYWVFAPTELVTGSNLQPAPLVIAFHGAGGDERMFLDGYGNGQLRRLASLLGFILVTPSTNDILLNPDLFNTLLDEVRRDYQIDAQRVYLVGHSLGGVLTARLTSLYTDRIAATLCIAGGMSWAEIDNCPPTYVAAGLLDPINPPARLKGLVDAARAAGKPVEFHEFKNYGHTLLVGPVLTDAVPWLLEQRRGSD